VSYNCSSWKPGSVAYCPAWKPVAAACRVSRGNDWHWPINCPPRKLYLHFAVTYCTRWKLLSVAYCSAPKQLAVAICPWSKPGLPRRFTVVFGFYNII